MSFQKVSEIILKEGHFLVLVVPYGEHTFKTIVFRVAGAVPLIMEYDKIDYIDPGSYLDYNYLGYDGFGLGDDMLTIADEIAMRPAWKIYTSV